MSIVKTYPESVRWTFRSKVSGYENTQRLVLHWEPSGSPMSDDYLPSEASASELWEKWASEYCDQAHQQRPDVYAPGQVPVYWFVTSVEGGTWEAAPHQNLPADFPLFEDFLTHFTHPTREGRAEPINWNRVPVRDLAWNGRQADKGGFIQEATGWKPAPLQPFMDVRQVANAAGVYVP